MKSSSNSEYKSDAVGAVLILHAFAQHTHNYLHKHIKILGIQYVCIWNYAPQDVHPYIHETLQLSLKRIPNAVSTADIKQLVKERPRVIAFEALNKDMDIQLQKCGVLLIPPLWFSSSIDMRRWFREHMDKRMVLKHFYKYQLANVGMPHRYYISTDKDNRNSLKTYAGDESQYYTMPLTPEDALEQLDLFIYYRFGKFAKYQDAVVPGYALLFHSGLSMAINVGLLIPQDIAQRIVKLPFSANSEAYMRQLIGWREYAICYYKYTKPLITNFKSNKRHLSYIWFKKTPELAKVPIIHDILSIVWQTGYAHHILRLYLLSFMIQLELHPDDIYKWMKRHFVDANDWVMTFNVYAMGYFDTRFTSKSYLFSSNYIVEQSGGRYKRCPLLDALYHRFIYKNPQPRQPTIKEYDKHKSDWLLAVFTTTTD